MSTTTLEQTIWRPDEIAIGSALNEPDWAMDYRKNAARQFDGLPHPTSIDEPWRRTDLSSVKFESFSGNWDPLAGGEMVESLTPHERYLRVHTGQGTQPPRGHLFLSAAGVTTDIPNLTAMPLELALQRLPRAQLESWLKFEPHAGYHPSLHRFQAAVHAFRNAGTYLYVAPKTKLILPIGVVATLFSENGALYTHNILHIGRGSTIEIAEEFLSPADKRALLSLSFTRIIVEPEATLKLTSLQNFGAGAYHFGTHHISLHRDANFELVWGGFGSRIAKSRIFVELLGENSSAKIGGFVAGAGRQHLDHDTTQHHVARKTQSDLLFKGVVTGRSRSLYQGMIVVDKTAQKTDAYQSVKHLILSETARVDALPGLEILADDVRCTHGATTRPLDEEELYYMACRGLSREQAQELLIEAHLEPILARIPNRDLQDRCRDAVTLKLMGHTL